MGGARVAGVGAAQLSGIAGSTLRNGCALIQLSVALHARATIGVLVART